MCSSHGAVSVSFNGFAQSRARERFGPQRRTAGTVIDPSPMAPEPVAAVAEAPTPPPPVAGARGRHVDPVLARHPG